MPQKQATSTAYRGRHAERRLSLIGCASMLALLSMPVGRVYAHQSTGHSFAGQVFVVETVAIGSDPTASFSTGSVPTGSVSRTTGRIKSAGQASDHSQSALDPSIDPVDPIPTDIASLTGGIHWPKAALPGFAYPDQNAPDPLWSTPTIVPLPPAIWAGFIGTAVIGTQLVRRSIRRPSRARFF